MENFESKHCLDFFTAFHTTHLIEHKPIRPMYFPSQTSDIRARLEDNARLEVYFADNFLNLDLQGKVGNFGIGGDLIAIYCAFHFRSSLAHTPRSFVDVH